jgi:hypothetical protein
MDQSSYRRRIRGIRDYRKPSCVPFLVAPGRAYEGDDVTVVCKWHPLRMAAFATGLEG